MDAKLAALVALSFAINLLGTLAYSVRIAGVRTRRIALSISLFNALALVSRTAGTLQVPLLSKRIEKAVAAGTAHSTADLRWLILSASVATVAGALLMPTFQRLFTRAVAT